MEKIAEQYKVKKLEVEKEKCNHLPVWFGHLLYNKMMPRTEQALEAKDNPLFGGYHFYSSYNKPISTLIDFSEIKKDEI